MPTLRSFSLRAVPVIALVLAPACHPSDAEHRHHEAHRIVVSSPLVRDVTLTQQYVALIHSRRHIKVCALEGGYLEAIPVKEGQKVKAGEVLFTILPTLYKARLEAEQAEAQLAQLEVNITQKLVEQKVVSVNELALQQAKLAKALARVKLAEAELNFTTIRAPFDGIVDRLHEQQGSLVKEGDVLTTLSDNSVMWVYFNVPEARYLEYMAGGRQLQLESVELILANGTKFPHTGTIGAIEAKFNKETGNIPFRADFPNPDGLLRHEQTGTVLLHKTIHDAIVIPQQATFEVLNKRYVYVVTSEGTVKQQEITVQHELDDLFVVSHGLKPTDRYILEGVRQVQDGDRCNYEYREPQEALANLKYHAE